MKIACLQFAPQVGDVDNNLNRADAVLNRAKAEDLEGLDLLVLPELAFSGYNYRSLQHISAYLEPPGSGISSLWARTTALKHDCVVIVGYPEKVDITARWPASPEYYNSALIVNGDGETIGNYRKSFLYHTDETWALEGKEGFFEGNLPGLGNVALGICMDINPYKFESKWDTFEFGFHILEVQANVVILTMAWHTNQDISIFSRRPQEPDLETLVYWVQRLEPLIKAENEQEVVVIFCNRSGIEDDVMYTGTSAVLGVKGGEVFVYGLLGRGVKELLVVDTSNPPISKLTNADGVEAENSYVEEMAEDVGAHGQSPVSHKPQTSIAELLVDLGEPVDEERGLGIFSPVSPTSPMWPAAAPQMEEVIVSPRSPIRLQIPVRSFSNGQTSIDGAIMQDTIIESPDGSNLPSPIQTRALPRLVIPSSPWRFHKKASPHPWHLPDKPQSHVFNGKVAMTPITAFDID
ncbi:carbon-nitrogen hydrolase, partial [Lasiosphaeria hispida]